MTPSLEIEPHWCMGNGCSLHYATTASNLLCCAFDCRLVWQVGIDRFCSAFFEQLFQFWATVSILSKFFDFPSTFYQSDNFWYILAFQIKHRTKNLATRTIFTLYLGVSSIYGCIVGYPVVYVSYMDVSLGILCLYSKYRTAYCIVESIENGGSLERKRIPYSNEAEMMETARASISRKRKVQGK